MKRSGETRIFAKAARSMQFLFGQIALMTLLLATGSPAVAHGQGASQAAPGHAVAAAHLDQRLVARLARADDNEPVRVIVTVRPGAKRGLIRALQAQGATISADFTVIEAFAGSLPPGLLRALQHHPDVLAISTDAGVTASGISTAVSGVAANSPYTLRRTLGLDVGPAPITVGTTTTTKGVGAQLAWWHTVDAGSNRFLLVEVASYAKRSPSVTSLTYAGVPLTKLAQVSSRTSPSVEFWYLTAPPAGTAMVVLKMKAVGAVAAGATSFSGVNQAEPTGTAVSAIGNGSEQAITVPSAFGDLVVAAATSPRVSSFQSGAEQSVRWTAKTGTTDADVWGVGAAAPGAASVTMTWTTSGSGAEDWATAAVSLKPAAPSSGGTIVTGAGVTVAVIDSGLLQDGGTTSRYKTSRDFTGGLSWPAPGSPMDPYGHGTHVGGLIAGGMDEALGVAPGASFVSLRVLNSLGAGLTSHVMAALQWAVAYKDAYGIDVINLSLGHPILEPAATDPLVQAVEAAVRAGIVVVVSAGNMGYNPVTGEVGYGGIGSPGNAPSAITVGAVKTFDTTSRADDVIADYSSRGPAWYDGFVKPDLVAPGHRLVSAAAVGQTLYTLWPDLRETRGGRPYLKLSGSSMATGVVSGTVALMIEAARANFGMAPTPNAIKAMLEVSAFPMSDAGGTPYHVLAQGAGAANPAGAVTLAKAIDPAMPVGSGWLATGVTESTTVDGQDIAWGTNIVWGSNIVWGNALYAHNIVWSNNIVWGASVDWGDNIVWGSNIVWSTAASGDDNIVWGNGWWDNIVWGNGALGLRDDDDNIVWGSAELENIVWGTSGWEDNIVWGNLRDNIVWGTGLDGLVWSGTTAGGF